MTPEVLGPRAARQLDRPDRRGAECAAFQAIHVQLRRNASARAADAILELRRSASAREAHGCRCSIEWPRPGCVAGVDEAGRGPLAGPVLAAAVMLDPARPHRGPRATRRCSTPARRERLAGADPPRAAWLGHRLGGRGRDRCAEHPAGDASSPCAAHCSRCRTRPGMCVVDGDRCPIVAGLRFACTIEAVVGGDAQRRLRQRRIHPGQGRARCVHARAGVLAIPATGSRQHKGYATPTHLAGAAPAGPVARCIARAFAPVQSRLLNSEPRSMQQLRSPARPHRVLAGRQRRAYRERARPRRRRGARGPDRRGGRLGMPAVALTDQGNLFALVKFYRAAHGARRQAADRCGRSGCARTSERAEPSRLVLLCQNERGYLNLTRLVSRAYLEGAAVTDRLMRARVARRATRRRGSSRCRAHARAISAGLLLAGRDRRGTRRARALAGAVRRPFLPRAAAHGPQRRGAVIAACARAR